MKLYNSLTQTKETFTPIQDNEVRLYVCGITPYDTTHLGHAFTYTAFDVLYRFLTSQKYKVIYTQNVTDIDDDILKKAKQVNRDWKELGQSWTDKYVGDMKTLNNTPPRYYVKATETMPTIIEVIEKLVSDGFAYEKGGNVYFDTQKDADYGKLSKYSRSEMIKLSGERGADPGDPNKKDPLDFIMWQAAKPGEPTWDSPWGKGRPGWHIECSAMVYKYLGKKIDIHGGGSDLLYPHHESEIAQSEQFTGEKSFSQFWMHTGAVRYEGEKMSKSLGNLVMVSQLLPHYTPNEIRYLLLSHHYRISWEYTLGDLAKARHAMQKIEKVIQVAPTTQGDIPEAILQQFTDALADDLDTPKALASINELLADQETHPTYETQEAILSMMDVLGFKIED